MQVAAAAAGGSSAPPLTLRDRTPCVPQPPGPMAIVVDPLPERGWRAPRETSRYYQRCTLCSNLIHRRFWEDWDSWKPLSLSEVQNGRPSRIWHDGRGTFYGIRCWDCETEEDAGQEPDYDRSMRRRERWPAPPVPAWWR